MELHLVDAVSPGVMGVQHGPVRVGEAAVLLGLGRPRQAPELREGDHVVPLDPPGDRLGEGSVLVEEVPVDERFGLVGDLVRAHYRRVGRADAQAPTSLGGDDGEGGRAALARDRNGRVT